MSEQLPLPTTRAATGPRDRIVIIELSLDAGHEVVDVIACIRAGAAAWFEMPARGVVDAALRPKDVERVLAVAQEIEDEARRVHEAREAFFRAETKADAKAARKRERESGSTAPTPGPPARGRGVTEPGSRLEDTSAL